MIRHPKPAEKLTEAVKAFMSNDNRMELIDGQGYSTPMPEEWKTELRADRERSLPPFGSRKP